MIKYKRDLFDYEIVIIPKEIQTVDNFNNVDLEREIDKFQKELNWPEMWTVKDAISRLKKDWYFNVLKINNGALIDKVHLIWKPRKIFIDKKIISVFGKRNFYSINMGGA